MTVIDTCVPRATRESVDHRGMSFFDLFAADYDMLKAGMDEEDKWNFVSNTTEIHLDFIKAWVPSIHEWTRRLPWPKGSVHVDIGSGIGSMSYLIARQGYHSVAIELNATNLAGGATVADAIATTDTQSMQLWVANIFDIPLADHSVDFVTIKEVLHHLPDPTALFNELSRILKPGGIVYVWEPFWPCRATGPLRWFLIEKVIRPVELARGVHHVHYSWFDYRRMFQQSASKFEMRPIWKRGKWRHILSQNRIGFGQVEAELTLKPVRPRPVPPRRQIDPHDFILPQYLERSIEAAERYKAYLESVGRV